MFCRILLDCRGLTEACGAVRPKTSGQASAKRAIYVSTCEVKPSRTATLGLRGGRAPRYDAYDIVCKIPFRDLAAESRSKRRRKLRCRCDGAGRNPQIKLERIYIHRARHACLPPSWAACRDEMQRAEPLVALMSRIFTSNFTSPEPVNSLKRN